MKDSDGESAGPDWAGISNNLKKGSSTKAQIGVDYIIQSLGLRKTTQNDFGLVTCKDSSSYFLIITR